MAAPTTDHLAIRTQGVSKRFGATVALAEVSVEVEHVQQSITRTGHVVLGGVVLERIGHEQS